MLGTVGRLARHRPVQSPSLRAPRRGRGRWTSRMFWAALRAPLGDEVWVCSTDRRRGLEFTQRGPGPTEEGAAKPVMYRFLCPGDLAT